MPSSGFGSGGDGGPRRRHAGSFGFGRGRFLGEETVQELRGGMEAFQEISTARNEIDGAERGLEIYQSQGALQLDLPKVI